MFLSGDAPLPREYRFMQLDGLLRARCRTTPASVCSSRVDCAKATGWARIRSPVRARELVLDIDHHHDNTRFGDVNLIVAGRVVDRRGAARRLRASSASTLTPEIAEPLYIALVTDTGRFQYTNTTPKSLRLAAELVEAGADVHQVFQQVYESVEFAKLKLLARALERAQVYEGGRIVVSYLLRDDFAEVGAAEPYSEGIIDYLRAVEGARARRAHPRAAARRRAGRAASRCARASTSSTSRRSPARSAAADTVRRPGSRASSIDEITELVVREFVAARDGTTPPRASDGRARARRGRHRFA